MTVLRIGLIVIAALVMLVAVVAAVGAWLPRDHVATRSLSVAASPDAVFATIADVGSYAAWRTSRSGVEVLAPLEGRARWVEVSGRHRIEMEQVERLAPRRLVTRIADSDLPFGGTWTFDLQPEQGGTRLAITERGEIRPPIFRAVARFVLGYGATLDTFLGELRARLA
jgi:hypothetical protein